MRSFSASNTLYQRALETVPLASQTFSKSSMMQVRGAAPLFLERGRGSRVWDVDGNEYIDLVMGLLPIVLGYRDESVDRAILEQMEKGISFSLATELEVELAETLVDLIPCAEMVRFGKNGSDVTTAAIRLARTMTQRERVACCGYHGWHDWYIGTTSRDLGVPGEVKKLTSAFTYNDAGSLESLLKAAPTDYAAIILEPAGAVDPAPGFLEAVRGLADKYGVVLIYDEIITGFRMDPGGAQRQYGVIPDLACFGKAMGNGMPISALVGRQRIMKGVEDIFFSGTFGGEALSLAAANATIKKIVADQVCETLWSTGAVLKARLATLIESHALTEYLSVAGPDWWPALASSPHANVRPSLISSLFRQELCENGVLMLATLNLSLAHCGETEVEELARRIDLALGSISDHLRSDDPDGCLRGEEIRPVFQARP